MATGFPVKNNYATGDVLTAANMNDLSGTLNYLQYAKTSNPILNSSFNVWQRGTSISTASANVYTADRWATTAAAATYTISRQATGDTTNLPNIQYCLRFQRNSGQTNTTATGVYQAFETVNSIPFSGKTITFSFYARAGANYSPTSSLIGVQLFTGTGTDQNPYSGGYTGQVIAINTTQAITTTWTRYSFTATLNATVTEIAPSFYMSPTGTASTNDYFEITGVQLELGSVANTYMPNQPTYQGELAACQRYYFRYTSDSATYTVFGSGINGSSTTGATINVQCPVQMRAVPTSIDYSTLALSDGAAVYAISSASLSSVSGKNVLGVTVVTTGLTAYRPYALHANNSASGYIGASAEL